MNLQEVSKALASTTRLRLLVLIAHGERSAIATYEEYRKKYNDKKHRESIYRELEKLTKAEILRKHYNAEKKELVYRLNADRLNIDLINGTIFTE